MIRHGRYATLLLATALGGVLAAPAPSRADSSDTQMRAIEKQIESLQAEIRHMKKELASKKPAPGPSVVSTPPAMPAIPPGYALVPAQPGSLPNTVILTRVQPVPPPEPFVPGQITIGGVHVRLGGFIEAAGIFRTRNEVADIASNFSTGIPLPNSALYHENQFLFSARQTRFSMDAGADPTPVTHLDAYGEIDFLGAAPTANSVETDSYTPRIRHLFAVYQRKDLGIDILGGQTWTLLTMQPLGIGYDAQKAMVPLTIDPQYVPGFTWARQPQFRIVDHVSHEFALAASVENPQTNYYVGGNGAVPKTVGTVDVLNPGGSAFASSTNYSTEVAPDFQAKAALDLPGAHFEAYGVMRFMHDRVSQTGGGESKTVLAGGGGADALFTLIPKRLEVRGSFLAGEGIGRYGSAQLPDATVGSDGAPRPLPEVEALLGVVGHPTLASDIYAYAGTEQIGARYFENAGKGYGYGSPIYSNETCSEELGAGATCVGNTSGIIQGTVGWWWKFAHGPTFGSMQIGAQYSYTHRSVFQGLGPTPSTDDHMIFISFRYYPFSDTAPNGLPNY